MNWLTDFLWPFRRASPKDRAPFVDPNGQTGLSDFGEAMLKLRGSPGDYFTDMVLNAQQVAMYRAKAATVAKVERRREAAEQFWGDIVIADLCGSMGRSEKAFRRWETMMDPRTRPATATSGTWVTPTLFKGIDADGGLVIVTVGQDMDGAE